MCIRDSLGTNRNKRSITVDIARPEGQALIRRMALACDVFVENYKVGDMARYGLDYASLQALNPRLVYCSVTGFGQTGPYAPLAGYDFMIQGMAGVMDLTGFPDGPPMKAGYATADIYCGLYAAIGILAALRRRGPSGTAGPSRGCRRRRRWHGRRRRSWPAARP